MKIGIVGGGPAGLYFALLMKKLDASHRITVVEVWEGYEAGAHRASKSARSKEPGWPEAISESV